MTGHNGASLDIEANRKARKWSRKALAGRVLWGCAGPLFALSPRPLWGLRTGLLRLFGARIGARVHIHPSVCITIPWNLTIGDDVGIGERAILYALGPIDIARAATISQHAHLCAGSHDHRDRAMPLTKPPVRIGAGAWVCADAFVGPGVSVGDFAVVAARAVAVRDVAERAIVAGNPAKTVGRRVFDDEG